MSEAMNQLIRDRVGASKGLARTEAETVEEAPPRNPDFGTYGSVPILNRPRRSTNDRLRSMFDNRPRAGTHRIGA